MFDNVLSFRPIVPALPVTEEAYKYECNVTIINNCINNFLWYQFCASQDYTGKCCNYIQIAGSSLV